MTTPVKQPQGGHAAESEPFLQNAEDALQKYNFEHDMIFNADETGLDKLGRSRYHRAGAKEPPIVQEGGWLASMSP